MITGLRNVFILFLLCHGPLVAGEVTPLEHVETDRIDSSSRSEHWGLSSTEWQRYQDVMSAQRGVWSPGLDPITALGVSADTAAERNRYAALYVRTEFERTRKELAFQLAVDRAWARLYPDTPRLQAQAIPAAADSDPVRLALIVSTQCPDCDSTLTRKFAGLLAQAQEGIDVHVVGTGGDDAVLRDWIAHQPHVLAALKAGKVTVNHGHTFAKLTSFPAIYAKSAEGQWSRQL